MDNKIQRVKRNLIGTTIQRLVNLFVPFFTQTILIYCLGIEYVGLNSFLTNILSILSITELGINSALTFCMYKPIAQDNDDEVCAILNFYNKCNMMIGGILLVVGFLIMPFLGGMISKDIPSNINIYLAYLIYLSNTVLSYVVFPSKLSLVIACQRVDVSSNIETLSTIIKALLQWTVLIFAKSYWLFIIFIPIITVLRNIFIQYWTKKEYPQYYCYGKVHNDLISMIKDKVKGVFCQRIGNIALYSTDGIIISFFLGLTVNGIFSNYSYIYNGLMSIITGFIAAVVPIVGNEIIIQTENKNYHKFNKINSMIMWVVSWFAICQACLLQPFLELWVGKDKMFDTSYIIFFVMYFYFSQIGAGIQLYKEASGIWFEGWQINIFSAVVNLILDCIFIKIWGIKGILAATILTMVLIILPFNAFIIFNHVFKSKKKILAYYKTVVVNSIACFIIGSLTYFLCQQIKYSGILSIIMRVPILIIVPNVFFVIIYRKRLGDELFLKVLNKIRHR